MIVSPRYKKWTHYTSVYNLTPLSKSIRKKDLNSKIRAVASSNKKPFLFHHTVWKFDLIFTKIFHCIIKDRQCHNLLWSLILLVRCVTQVLDALLSPRAFDLNDTLQLQKVLITRPAVIYVIYVNKDTLI